jgi:hypothetical protein
MRAATGSAFELMASTRQVGKTPGLFCKTERSQDGAIATKTGNDMVVSNPQHCGVEHVLLAEAQGHAL